MGQSKRSTITNIVQKFILYLEQNVTLTKTEIGTSEIIDQIETR